MSKGVWKQLIGKGTGNGSNKVVLSHDADWLYVFLWDFWSSYIIMLIVYERLWLLQTLLQWNIVHVTWHTGLGYQRNVYIYNSPGARLQWNYLGGSFLFLFCFLFGSGVVSFMPNFVSLLPQQFPLATYQQNPFTTRNAWVFFRNSWAFRLSCVLPLWRWQPKNFSRGSWHIRLLRKNFTPGTVNRKRTSLTNDFTARKGKVH